MRSTAWTSLVLLCGCTSSGGGEGTITDTDPTSSTTTSTSTTDPTSSTSSDTDTTTGSTTTAATETGGTTETTGTTGGEEQMGPFGSGTRLRANYFDGGEGAVFHRFWRDTELAIDCQFRETGDGTYHCFPDRGGGFRFADAGCTEPVANTGTGLGVGDLVVRGFQLTCGAPIGAWEITGTTDLATTYLVGGGGTCETSSGGTVLTMTEVANSEFVSATSETVGAGDILATRAQGEDGSFQNLRLVGTDGTPCTQFPVGDTTRCVPEPIPTILGQYYGDDQCTQNTVAALPFNGSAVCPANDPAFVSEGTNPDGCNPTNELYVAGASIPATNAYINLGTCGPVSEAGPGFEGGLFWGIGAADDGSGIPAVSILDLGGDNVTIEYVTDDDSEPLWSRAFTNPWNLPDGRPCSPTVTTGGVYRCLSDGDGLYVADGGDLYADAKCTQRVIARNNDCNFVATYFYDLDGDGAVSELFEADDYTGQLYLDGDGCGPTATNVDTVYFTPGTSLPLDTFPTIDVVQD